MEMAPPLKDSGHMVVVKNPCILTFFTFKAARRLCRVGGGRISRQPALYKSHWRHWSFCWMTYCFGETIHLHAEPTSSGVWTFPPPGLFPVPLSPALLSFIPGELSCPCLDFAVWKSNMRYHKVKGGAGAAREAHEQTDNWVWGCHSRLRSHALADLFFNRSSYCSVHPLWRNSRTSVCARNVGIRREKPQRWLKTVKTHYNM